MIIENYPATVRVLTPTEVVARWRELGWGDASASQHGMVNEYGIPFHACNGVRQDEHYWAWLRAKRLAGQP